MMQWLYPRKQPKDTGEKSFETENVFSGIWQKVNSQLLHR